MFTTFIRSLAPFAAVFLLTLPALAWQGFEASLLLTRPPERASLTW